jgi:hypothetical protein
MVMAFPVSATPVRSSVQDRATGLVQQRLNVVIGGRPDPVADGEEQVLKVVGSGWPDLVADLGDVMIHRGDTQTATALSNGLTGRTSVGLSRLTLARLLTGVETGSQEAIGGLCDSLA